MFMELGKFSPNVKLGFVSASRNCFPRELVERRSAKLLEELSALGINPVLAPASISESENASESSGIGDRKSAVIETRADAVRIAEQFRESGCDAAVLFLGNFSPEIEDAEFVKNFGKPVLLIAAAEENSASVKSDRGDAFCGLISASLAIGKRGLSKLVTIPQNPIVDAKSGATEIARYVRTVATVKGVSHSTIALFGPRPRDFESCNYNASSIMSLGVEVEELGLFDLRVEMDKIRSESGGDKNIAASISKVGGGDVKGLAEKLSVYEKALLEFRDKLRLSGAAIQCWTHFEDIAKHVPCMVNARLCQKGFPVACENDAYSLVAELMAQYASNEAITMLDINHSIPADLLRGKDINPLDTVGLFHCGNVPAKFMNSPRVCFQAIMARNLGEDVTRGTLEGAIKENDITMFQLHGSGDGLRAYICEGKFLDVDPNTFGSVGVAYFPGFRRFYRNCILGRFHHHAAVAFKHCGAELFDVLHILGVDEIYTPSPLPYPGENVFAK